MATIESKARKAERQRQRRAEQKSQRRFIKIYIYENLTNGKVYIGRTIDLKRRDYGHIACKDGKMPIDLAIRKYGRHNFSLNVITEVETNDRADYAEIEWIARARELLGRKNVYNIADGGGPNIRGHKLTPEHCANISKGKTGKVMSEEAKKNMSIAHRGKIVSEETKQKTAESLRLSWIKKRQYINNGRIS